MSPGTGVYAWAYSDYGQAVHGEGTGAKTEGVLGTAAHEAPGVYGISGGTGGDAIGVLGQTKGTWGLKSNNSLYVVGSCTGCTMAFVALNADASALELGDIVSVSGVAPALKGEQKPVLKVKRATSTSGAALGVVQARAEVNVTDRLTLNEASEQEATLKQGKVLEAAASPDGVAVPKADLGSESVETVGMAEGPVAPGDYLFIVVQGLTQVRVDPAAGVKAGDRLMVGDGGRAATATADAAVIVDTPMIGRAVDAVDASTGLVWVLVDLQ
jgi:hypothetical protein